MLISVRQCKKAFGIASLLAALVVIGYGVSRTSTFKSCQAHHDQYAAYQEQQEGPLALKWVWRNAKVWLRCGLEFTEAHHGPLTALATIALAIFTTTLWWATRKLVQHAPQIERAYISGGGAPEVRTVPGETVIYPGEIEPSQLRTEPTGNFVLMVNNYGKTAGELREVGFGFCDARNIPPAPAYTRQYFYDWIQPGDRGRPLFPIPIPTDRPATAVYGRFYYRDIFGSNHSCGFINRIERPGESTPILAPTAYTEERDEP